MRVTAKDLPRACWLCGRNGNGDPLDAHHIFGGANRRLSERYGLVVPLCHHDCHESGKNAVHRNGETMQLLHEWGQRKAMEEQGWTVEDFRRIFGRSYIDEEDGYAIHQTVDADAFRPDDEAAEGVRAEWAKAGDDPVRERAHGKAAAG